jgi:hypothetical protein
MLYSVSASAGTAEIGFFFRINMISRSPQNGGRVTGLSLENVFIWKITKKVESIGSRWKKPAIPGRRIIDPEVTGESQTSK